MSAFLGSMKATEQDSDQEEEELSIASSSEDNDEDHDLLIEAISSLRKKRHIEQRDEPSNIISEFHLSTNQQEDSRVDAMELLQGLTNKKGLKQLKQRLSKINDQSTQLVKPLAPVQKDRIRRKLAYEKSSKQVSDWAPIVKHNRRAEHLLFPLQEDVPSLPSLTTKVDSFKAVTPLEIAVQDMLSKSDHVIGDNEELSKAEERALLKLSIQEAKERRSELRKMRSLLSAYEQKQRRINRVKSKKFHKIQRKRKEKIEEKRAMSESEQNDSLKKAERLRAQERATLKHSRMSKWAKDQLNKKHRDPATRLALTEQSRLKANIKQKAHQESESDEAVSEPEQEEIVDALSTDPDNVWLAETSETSGIKGDVFPMKYSTEKKSNKKSSKVTELYKKEPANSRSIIDPTDFFTTEALRSDDVIGKDDNILAVKEAFADDDVVEFLKEKQKEIEASHESKKVDMTLPGWGKWAGQGVEVRKRKRKNEKQQMKKIAPRKDDKLKYVIINEGGEKKAAKHFVSHVPYPYCDRGLFARRMATPIGRHWNTETHFNEIIKPRIKTRIGTVIEPMRRTDDVEQFIKKTRVDQRKRKHL